MDENVKDINGPDWVIQARPRVYTWCYSFEPTFDVTYLTTSAPNRFVRWVQRHLFGIYWRKL